MVVCAARVKRLQSAKRKLACRCEGATLCRRIMGEMGQNASKDQMGFSKSPRGSILQLKGSTWETHRQGRSPPPFLPPAIIPSVIGAESSRTNHGVHQALVCISWSVPAPDPIPSECAPVASRAERVGHSMWQVPWIFVRVVTSSRWTITRLCKRRCPPSAFAFPPPFQYSTTTPCLKKV